MNQVERELTQAEKWVHSFQQTEKEILESGQLVSFKRVLDEMSKKGIFKVKVNSSLSRLGINVTPQNVIFYILICLCILLIFSVYKIYKGKRFIYKMRLELEAKKQAILQEFSSQK